MWPSDAMWRKTSKSTLAQVTAASHYLNQWWLIISKVQWQSERYFTRDASVINHQILLFLSEFYSNLWSANVLIKDNAKYITSRWYALTFRCRKTTHDLVGFDVNIQLRNIARVQEISSAISNCITWPVIVRRAGLLWSQLDFEWLWSVPLSSASLY